MFMPKILPFNAVFTAVFTAVFWCSGLLVSSAQENGEPWKSSRQGTVNADIVDAELESIDADPNLDDTQKASSKEILQRAKRSLEAAKLESEQARRFAKNAATVRSRTEQLRKSLEHGGKGNRKVAEDEPVETLSQRLATANAELKEATTKATTLSREPARRRTRLAEIPGLIADSQRELAEVKEQLSEPYPPNETAIESAARTLLLKARVSELDATIDRLDKEQLDYSASVELLPLEQKVVSQRAILLAQEIKLLQDTIVTMQSRRARETTEALKKTTNEVPSKLRELAEKNLELAKVQARLISESSANQQILKDVQLAVQDVTGELQTSKLRVDSVGLTDALGLMFRERRRKFEELRLKYRPRDELKQLIQQYQIESFRLEDELEDVKESITVENAPSIDWEADEVNWDSLSETDGKWVLRRKRQKLIEGTQQAQNEVLQTMLTSDTQRRQLLIEIDRFNDFVDQHLFWTRSAPAMSMAELKASPKTVQWVTDLKNWTLAEKQFVRTTASRPVQTIGLLCVLIAIVYTRPRFRRSIVSEGKEADRFNATYRSTLHSLSATIGSAAAWPFVFGFASFLCLASSTGNPFVQGLGYGFGVTALFVASREFLKEVCRKDGLAERHFGWSNEVRAHLRRHLRWYTFSGGLTIFFLVVYHEHPDTLCRTLATRVLSTALFLITALFHHAVLRNRSPIYSELIRVNPDSFIFHWRKVIWTVAVILPLSFGAMSMAGYLETTYRLGRSLQSTFFLLVIVIIVLGLIARWLTLHRRDIARHAAMESRDRRMVSENETETANIANEAGIVLEDETKMDLPTLDHQTRQTAYVLASLIAIVGLAIIWSDLVPAVAYFDEIKLWTVGTGTGVETVSLKDMLYAALTVAALVFAIRNVPSMLELLVLSRTKLDSGARYAITTLLRYALVIIGAAVLLNLLSLPYNQLGWLVAAASVGLGFGLQEIVANFVSGIILLLERPVRVGDVVTIDGTTGMVSRIQMRATTVTNWDRKELVIPNKDLITEKLLNWTLSNVVNRLTIEVGVAYGTDPNKVRTLLRQIVSAHPEVMNDPPPLINFETFGDSSLNFVVRFFLPKLDNRIEVTHQINTAIAEALEQSGIEIPFPQRDVHVIKDLSD